MLLFLGPIGGGTRDERRKAGRAEAERREPAARVDECHHLPAPVRQRDGMSGRGCCAASGGVTTGYYLIRKFGPDHVAGDAEQL